MDDFDRHLKECLKDAEFKKEWDALENEYKVIETMIEARAKKNMTQKDLSEATGIAQANISKIERGIVSPTLKMLERLAEGMNMKLKIEFIPK